MSNEKLPEVTDEQWGSINKENHTKVEEFLRESIQLSDETLKQYRSALHIFFWWVKENAEDKSFYDIKSRDYLLYQNYLSRRGLSSSAIRIKRSAISSFNGYVEVYYQDQYPNFRNFINKKILAPMQVFVNEKKPLDLDEYKSLCDKLEEMEKWQELAYLKFSFSTGARRNEVRQLLKEIVTYEPRIVGDNKIYATHDIRCKGMGKTGKIRKLQMDEDAFLAIKKWLTIRGDDDCPYVFVANQNGVVKQVSSEALNNWCGSLFTKLVGRRVHPHAIRETRATTMVMEQSKDIKVVQKLLGHLSSSTSEIYVIRKHTDDSDEAFT